MSTARINIEDWSKLHRVLLLISRLTKRMLVAVDETPVKESSSSIANTHTSWIDLLKQKHDRLDELLHDLPKLQHQAMQASKRALTNFYSFTDTSEKDSYKSLLKFAQQLRTSTLYPLQDPEIIERLEKKANKNARALESRQIDLSASLDQILLLVSVRDHNWKKIFIRISFLYKFLLNRSAEWHQAANANQQMKNNMHSLLSVIERTIESMLQTLEQLSQTKKGILASFITFKKSCYVQYNQLLKETRIIVERASERRALETGDPISEVEIRAHAYDLFYAKSNEEKQALSLGLNELMAKRIALIESLLVKKQAGVNIASLERLSLFAGSAFLNATFEENSANLASEQEMTDVSTWTIK